MPETNNNQTTTINSDTIIQFTVKSFFATIGSILGLFAAFYFMVIVPKENSLEEYQKTLYEQQKEYVTSEFDNVNTAIQKNTESIESLSERFDDLNTTMENIENSGGGLGD